MSATTTPGGPPGNAKGPTVGAVEALGGDQSGQLDFHSEAYAAASARAATRGCALHSLAGGGFLLGGAGVAYEAPDLRAVGVYLRLLGGSHG